MKKFKIDDPELIYILVNKQLEPYNITIQELLVKYGDELLIDGDILWCTYYTATTKESAKWKEWCYNYIRKNVYGQTRLTKNRFNKLFSWIDLMWGLKINDYDCRRI